MHDGSGTRYRLLVAIGNPNNVEQLMRTAIDIARDRGGELVVTSVVLQSRDSPFSLLTDEAIKRKHGEAERDLVDRAVEFAAERGMTATGDVRVGHDLAKSVLQATRECEADAVLLGWKDHGRNDFRLGHNVDRVVHRAKCDVVVEKIGVEADGVESILVPTTGSTHAKFAAEIAASIARTNDAKVEIVHVVTPETETDESVQSILDSTAARVEGVPVETRAVEGDDVADSIAARSRLHDITVIGASRESLLERLVFGAVPETVGRRADGTIIMAKRNLGISSRLVRWFRGFTAETERPTEPESESES